MAYLEIKMTGGQARKLVLREGENLLGSGESASILLRDPLVAPIQARITVKGEHAVVMNLVTENPLFINGIPLAGERALAPGDQLIIGSARFHFFSVDLDSTREMLEMTMRRSPGPAVGPAAAAGTAPPTVTIPTMAPAPEGTPPAARPAVPAGVASVAPSPAPVAAAPEAESEAELEEAPHLEFTDTTGRVHWILLKDKELLAGSAPDCPLRFDDPLVEPRHAKIIRREDGVFLVDMESGQGVFLNNRRVFREALEEGDVIRLGHRTLVFHQPRPKPEPASPPAAPEADEEASPVPQAVAAARPRAKMPVAVWIAAGVMALLVAGVAVVLYLAPWRVKPKPDEARRQVQQWLEQREWAKAEESIRRGPAAILPEVERSELLARAQLENEAKEQHTAIVKSLQSGQLEPALERFFKIPPDSVYRPEAAAMIVREVEQRIDAVLKRPDPQAADFSEIVTLAEKLLQVDPQSGSAMSYVCLARLGENNLPEAIRSAEVLIAAYPQSAEGHYYRAFALYRSGRSAEALPSVEEALRLQPGQPDYLLLRAWLWIMNGRLGEARSDLGQVLAADPYNRTARVLYGRLTGAAAAAPTPAPATDTARSLLQRRRQTSGSSGQEESACQAFLRGDEAGARKLLQAMAQRLGSSPEGDRYRRLDDAMARIRQLYDEGQALAGTDPVGALSRWEEMRSLEQATFSGRRSRYSEEVSSRAAALLAQRAARDLADGQLDRAYTLALKAMEWESGQAEALGIQRQIDGMAEKLYLEGFRHYRMGDADGAREYWSKVLRTVPEASSWHRKAGEKLAEMEVAK